MKTIAALLISAAVASPLHAGASAADAQNPRQEPNRLIHETSPYLLQHAWNPVDWYPWGDEAFAKARAEDKPIFLSIGYSTCHWCHVMEKESFSDPQIAAILNEKFVSIKVDREERPDIDALYMAFLMATGGDGGWPANIFLTPDLEPFYGGTYFPPRDRDGRIGLESILQRLSRTWTEHRDQIEATGEQMLAALESFSTPRSSEEALGQPVVELAFEQLASRYQSDHGGFSPAPKFPQPVIHELLLRHHVRSRNARAAQMSLDTLTAMASGGIHDQIGGGFHRYSVDSAWVVPHFEKMLYDQAQLADVYLSAWQLSGDELFRETAAATLDFILESLTSPRGGFYAALDASSLPEADAEEKLEGAYYTWSWDEIETLFPEAVVPIVAKAYGIEKDGNVAEHLDPAGDLQGRNVLTRRATVSQIASELDVPAEHVSKVIEDAVAVMLRSRRTRPSPHLDDKVLTAWNGLTISAFARGAQVLDDERYLEAAVDAAEFVRNTLWDEETGTLWRRWRDGERGIEAFAEDYAFTIAGMLDLYEATFSVRWLELARDLQKRQDELFWNEKGGYYTLTGGKDDSILVDVPGDVDSVLPSHNSVSALNLVRLAQLTGDETWKKRPTEVIQAFGGTLQSNPQTMPLMVSALSATLSKPKQIIIAGELGAKDTRAILSMVHERYLPDSLLILADGGPTQERLTEWMPFLEYVSPIEQRATAYICENFVCKLPSNDPDVIRRQLSARPTP